jgi:hypothetical protein
MLLQTAKLAALCAVGLALSACAPPFEAGSSPTAQTSYSRCERGGKVCVLKPMALLVLDEPDPSRDFQLGNWILFDPHPGPGQHYIAFMDEANEAVCEGFYTSFVLNARAPLAVTCGGGDQGRGEIHFRGLQNDGPFSGETTGTGSIETDRATILFVHGVTPDEARHVAFDVLWEKYGGAAEPALKARAAHARRVASFPASLAARSADPASNADR